MTIFPSCVEPLGLPVADVCCDRLLHNVEAVVSRSSDRHLDDKQTRNSLQLSKVQRFSLCPQEDAVPPFHLLNQNGKETPR
jgi:hypothetical protein